MPSIAAPALANLHVLARDSAAEPCDLASGPWLAQAPRGAYTTARTFNVRSVFDLSFHVDRLASSVKLMLEDDVRAGALNAEDLQRQHLALADPTMLRPRVIQSLLAAVNCYLEATTTTAAAAVTGSEGGTSTPAASGGNHQEGPAANDGELKLTVLVTWDSDRSQVWSHVSALGPRPRPPVRAQVAGAPRANALAKDSEWVRQRQALEESKEPGVNEVLLADEEGRIFEGLSSNFFAIVDGKLCTAGEGVLLGTVRDLALEVARKEGMQIDLAPPRVADAARWEGAAVSSTSRLLLPLDSLRLPDGKEMIFSRGGLADRLEKLVAEAVAAHSEPLEG